MMCLARFSRNKVLLTNCPPQFLTGFWLSTTVIAMGSFAPNHTPFPQIIKGVFLTMSVFKVRSCFFLSLLPPSLKLGLSLSFLFFVAVSVHAEAELPEGNVNNGAEIYKNVCNGCHGVSIAPSLRGIIDRPVASVSTFATYSAALKAKKDLTWSKENLDTFLTNPGEFAPGTDMVQIIPDAQERADIIAFLATLPPPRK